MKQLKLKEFIGQTIKVKFLPNYTDIQNSMLKRNYKANNLVYNKYYSYVFHDNEIKVLSYSKLIFKYLQSCMKGFYGTKEGLFITDDNEQKYKYYVISNSGFVYPLQKKKDVNNLYLQNDENIDEKEIYDIVYHNVFNPFDLKNGYNIYLKIEELESYLKIDLMYKIEEPFFKAGDDKNKTIEMYTNFGTLNDFVNNYELENNFVNLNFDDIQAYKKEYFDNKTKQRSIN